MRRPSLQNEPAVVGVAGEFADAIVDVSGIYLDGLALFKGILRRDLTIEPSASTNREIDFSSLKRLRMEPVG